jgi:hypothetical protein
MSKTVLPQWTSKFRCYRCGCGNLSMDHKPPGNTGVHRTNVECLQCGERYGILWTSERSDKWLVCERKAKTVGKRNRPVWIQSTHPKAGDAFHG